MGGSEGLRGVGDKMWVRVCGVVVVVVVCVVCVGGGVCVCGGGGAVEKAEVFYFSFTFRGEGCSETALQKGGGVEGNCPFLMKCAEGPEGEKEKKEEETRGGRRAAEMKC